MLQWLRALWIEPIPTDVDIVLCPTLDLPSKDNIITYTFVVQARLDPSILERAVFESIELRLPRAGARLVRRNGSYEYHIPHNFTPDIPPAHFTRAHHDAPLSAFNLPPSRVDPSQPCVVDMPERADLFRSADTPQTLVGLLRAGTPLLHVHVCTLDDATLISMTSTHALFDAHGVRALAVAWTAAVNGRLDDVPIMPRDFSPLNNIQASTPQSPRRAGEPVRFSYDPGLFLKTRFILSFAWKAFRARHERKKLVCFPKAWLAEQKAQCTAVLEQRESKEFVGTVDVLYAWWYKALYAHRTDATLVRLRTVVNLRRMLPAFFPYPYLNNATGWCAATISAHDLGAQPVLETALAIRRSIATYVADTDTLRAEMAWLAQFAGVGKLVLPHLPGEEMLIASDWRSAELRDLDFSGARVDGSSAPATPVFTFSVTPQGGFSLERVGTLCCETSDALWVKYSLYEAEWERLKNHLNASI